MSRRAMMGFDPLKPTSISGVPAVSNGGAVVDTVTTADDHRRIGDQAKPIRGANCL